VRLRGQEEEGEGRMREADRQGSDWALEVHSTLHPTPYTLHSKGLR